MSELKAIRVLVFSGQEDDWNKWSKTFLATSTVKGYREALKPTDPSKKAVADQNVRAYSDLLLSCEDNVIFGIIEESISQQFPEGNARVAWEALCNKFEPKTGAAKVQLKHQFQTSTHNDWTEDPETWINSLELIRRKLKVLGTTIDDEDLMLHILNNLPKEYETAHI